jgi:hypothetical protein
MASYLFARITEHEIHRRDGRVTPENRAALIIPRGKSFDSSSKKATKARSQGPGPSDSHAARFLSANLFAGQ